jgi:hypothetical protein
MSLRSMSDVAVQREAGSPQKANAEVPTAEEGVQQATVPQSWGDMLVNAIPSEVLGVYTPLVGVIVGTIDSGEGERATLRWVLYLAFLAIVIVWIGIGYLTRTTKASRKRAFPWVETASAALAFAAWGLVMPGSPLTIDMSGDDLTIATALISAAGVLGLAALGVRLSKKA